MEPFDLTDADLRVLLTDLAERDATLIADTDAWIDTNRLPERPNFPDEFGEW